MTTSGISFELRDTKVSVGHVKLGSEVKDFCSDGLDKRVLFQLNSLFCNNSTTFTSCDFPCLLLPK